MAPRFMTKGKGIGRKVIPLPQSSSDIRSANMPAKSDFNDYRTSKAYLEDKLDTGGNIDKHSWSIGRIGSSIMISLGNLTDAGWYWSGKLKDMAGFMVRIVNSKVRTEFIETMHRRNVDFSKVRGILLKSIDENDGLYEMTGDNSRWKFGTTMPEVDEDMEFEEFEKDRGIQLSEAFKDDVRDIYYPEHMPDYKDIKGKYSDRYKEEMRDAVKDSGSFSEFTDTVSDIQGSFNQDIIEDLSETMNSGFRSVMFKVAKDKGLI